MLAKRHFAGIDIEFNRIDNARGFWDHTLHSEKN